MESEFDTEATAGEADNARKDKRRLAVRRPAESQVVDADRLRFSIIVTVSRQAATGLGSMEANNGRSGVNGLITGLV